MAVLCCLPSAARAVDTSTSTSPIIAQSTLPEPGLPAPAENKSVEETSPPVAPDAPAEAAPTSPDAPEAEPAATDPSFLESIAEGSAEDEPEGPIQSVIHYNAEDSIFLDVKHQTIRMHGEGVIMHDKLILEADDIFLDWPNHIVAASGKKNKKGKVEKKLTLTNEGVEYFAESVRYNFQSHRAVAKQLFTKQDDGILRADKIKKDRVDTYYSDHATYTTCNLAKPHFFADAQELKIIKDDKVVSGPFKLHFDDVPTPLGFLFGIFYFPNGSGIVFPRYGGSSDKGFCLQKGGYYINMYDYADLTLLGSIYSKGSTVFEAKSNYKQRYQFSGDMNYERETDRESREFQLPDKETLWKFQWNHRTENNRTSSWDAQVDLRSESAKKKPLIRRSNGASASMSSSVKYSNKLVWLPFWLPYKLAVSIKHSKNFQTKDATATLPDVSLSTENIYPFRKGGNTGNWYSDIYFQHKIEAANKLSSKDDQGKHTLDFFETKDWPELWAKGKRAVKHTVPLKTNIKILRYFNLTPTIQYRERWYWERINYDERIMVKKAPKETKERGFFRVWDSDFGAALSSTLYGTHIFGHNKIVQALRHQLEPLVSLTYTPDFSTPYHGYYHTRPDKETKLSKFKEGIYGSPKDRDALVLGMALKNRLDMKVRKRTEEGVSAKKVPILEGFDWSTEYDFFAKKHHLGDIKFEARTNLFDKLFDINFKSHFDPYVYEDGGTTKGDTFAWNHGKGLGHVKFSSLSIGTKLGPRKAEEAYVPVEEQDKKKEKEEEIEEDPEQYVDFDIPWSLDLRYNWTYTKLKPATEPKKTDTLGFTWTFTVTENWKLVIDSGYDLIEREFLRDSTSIGVTRDLHCWDMKFAWKPLAQRDSYEFSVGIKAPMLKDVRYSRNREYPNPKEE